MSRKRKPFLLIRKKYEYIAITIGAEVNRVMSFYDLLDNTKRI